MPIWPPAQKFWPPSYAHSNRRHGSHCRDFHLIGSFANLRATRVFPHQGGELKQHALKSVEETQGVLQQNDRLMGEVLSLLASIMRLTEGMAGVEDIHASAEGLLCDQKTLHTELAAFLEQVAELLADKLSAQAIIPAEPFLVLLSFFPIIINPWCSQPACTDPGATICCGGRVPLPSVHCGGLQLQVDRQCADGGRRAQPPRRGQEGERRTGCHIDGGAGTATAAAGGERRLRRGRRGRRRSRR